MDRLISEMIDLSGPEPTQPVGQESDVDYCDEEDLCRRCDCVVCCYCGRTKWRDEPKGDRPPMGV